MAYSTGSGNYVALMAAVLAHAIADGWTTSGGTWPISKGIVRGVNWSTFTVTEADRTLLGGGSKTARYLRLSVGTSPSNATSNASADATSCHVANMGYTFSAWHIFSDPSVSDHIHVVAQFSNGVNSDCYTHFSFGALDKHGMGHTGVVYATGSPKRGYSAGPEQTNQCGDWNGGTYARTRTIFNGEVAYSYSTFFNSKNSLVYIIDPTVSPVPAGWPLANTLLDQTNVLHVLSNTSTSINPYNPAQRSNYSASYKWSAHHQFTTPQPYSGAVSMGPLPFWLMQGLTASSQVMYLGTFPNVRTCSMESYADGASITYASEEWILFPVLRQTPWNQMQVLDVVSSGRSGFAYKKVA